MRDNLHLKYISFNEQQYIGTEWHELILLPWFITLVKSQCILTLKSHQSTNMCDDTLCSPPPPHPLSRCGSVVLNFMMRFNQSVVVSNVLIVLSDAARQDKFEGFKVNPDSIKQVLIPADGSESTTKGKFYKEIVKCLHVLFRRWTVYNCIPCLFN